MSKVWKFLKKRYLRGIEWMKVDEGLPSMMYLAVTIMEIFIFCKVMPENAMQYAKVLGVNLIFVYLYSIVVVERLDPNRIVKPVQTMTFIVMGLILCFTMAKNLNYCFLFSLIVAPILIAYVMIYVQENYIGFEDFIKLKGIGYFGTVVLTTAIPTITIIAPLITLEWGIFVKIIIVVSFILIAPLVCWADDKGYGIFGAMGIEW